MELQNLVDPVIYLINYLIALFILTRVMSCIKANIELHVNVNEMCVENVKLLKAYF